MTNIESKVENLVQEQIKNLGYEIYDVEYVKEGKDYFLRIFIENEKGISLEDCEKVSNAITEILDREDYIKEQYFLEVSSPGIERVLKKDKHLNANLESEVQIKLFKPLNSKKQYTGILKAFNKETVTVFIDDESLDIDRKNISQIKTVYNW